MTRQPAQPSEQPPLAIPLAPHLNRGLFSDYYLDEILPHSPEWLQLINEARQVRDRLRVQFERLTSATLTQFEEAQLEDRWVQPVLSELGHHFSVQVKVRYQQTGYRKPDYAFVAAQSEADALTSKIYLPSELRHVLAIGDAKRWGVPLDQSSRAGERNPSQQIDEYLRYSEVRWGILTDGRYWRLYERDTSKNNTYYAVDLPALLTNTDDGADEDFLYFFAFFRRVAFTEGWLESVLKGSENFAQQLSDTLEAQVYDALERIAQGFLDYRRNGLQPTPATLRDIYEQSLVLLYRLLFIFYAESRDILPLSTNIEYARRLSLDALKKDIARRSLADLDEDGSSFYGRLNDLFFAIDQGNSRYDLPAYNGRLFSAPDHPFLRDYVIGDRHLAVALDNMARVPDERDTSRNPRRVFVDYRDLDVRHLGAIYEKLLEYQLDVATVPLALRNDQYAPAAPTDTVTKRPDEVYLRTGSNERKVTGSYYTPDYIVRFIVERTLEPLLTAITRQHADQSVEGGWIIRPNSAVALRTEILAVNVLDPATGSGHFLVDASAYLAEWLRSLALAPDDLPAGEDELIFWKRQVVNACIYGVDINPLAVELAKLSLWLATLAQGKPLSFLDHHLKCGNSLVGARAAEIGLLGEANGGNKRRKGANAAQKAIASGQLALLSDTDFAPAVQFAVEQMGAIENTVARTVKDVKQQEQLYAALNDKLAAWRNVADVWTARHFGLNVDASAWKQASDYLRGKAIATTAPIKDIVARGSEIAAAQRFLHWELTFPEVFFNADGTPLPNPGFDAVIGNPPYVRQEFIAPIKNFLAASHEAVYSGTADLYIYFYHQGLRQLRRGGSMAYITANKWLRATYGEGLRGFLAAQSEVQALVDFGHAPIFKDADTFPIIAAVRKPEATPAPDAHAEVTQFPRAELGRGNLSDYTRAHAHRVPHSRFSERTWSLEPSDADDLMAKIRRAGIPLSEFIGGQPYYGIKTGLNEAFLIDTATKDRLVAQDPACAEIIKPYLRGQDIKRWSPEWAGEWMIVLKSSENAHWAWSDQGERAESTFASSYPAIYQHFLPLRERLIKREDQGRFWWELRSCTYYREFAQAKINVQRIAFHARVCIDTGNYYLNDSALMIPSVSAWLLASINSPVIWYFAFNFLSHKKDEALAMDIERLVLLPIAQPTDAIRAEVEPAVERLITLTVERRARLREALDWLRLEYGIEKPGQKLEAFPNLDADAFVVEVSDRRPSRSARLSPAAITALKGVHADYKPRVLAVDAEMGRLEGRLSDLVNAAYGLTPADVDLMWRTAPPRMPIPRP